MMIPAKMPKSCHFLVSALLLLGACQHTDRQEHLPALYRLPEDPFRQDSLDYARKAFTLAPSLVLRQSWNTQNEPGFRAGIVYFGVYDGALVGLAELVDDRIGNSATAPNSRTWETGDAFELFISDPAGDPYYEFHITPENQILQMRWPAQGTLQAHAKAGTLRHEDYFITGMPFETRTWVQKDRWWALFRLPLVSISEDAAKLPASVSLAFCRYDTYPSDSQVIYSTSSNPPFAGFHEIEYWREYRVSSPDAISGPNNQGCFSR